jgi:hypothetical protein
LRARRAGEVALLAALLCVWGPARGALAEAASPAPVTSFLGLADDMSGLVPPDANAAVGPDRLVVALNTQVQVQDRSGAVQSVQTLAQFWSPLGSFAPFDPRVAYDGARKRWLMVSAANARSASSALLVAVSQSADPAGEWYRFRVTDGAGAPSWIDFPNLGFSADKVVVTANVFRDDDDAFARSDVFVFGKDDLYRGSASPSILQDAELTSLAPSTAYDDGVDAVTLVATKSPTEIAVRTVGGAPGLISLSSPVTVASPQSWLTAPARSSDFLPQAGSARKIDAEDARIQNCVERRAEVWCAHTVFLTNPDRAAIQWWRLSASGGARPLIARGRIDDPSGVANYAFPSVAVNASGAALIGFTRFTPNDAPSAAYALRTTQDAAFERPVVYRAGEAPYVKNDRNGLNRWGDFSSTLVDPADDQDFWTLQEYSMSPSGDTSRWGTWWAHVGAPAFSLASETFPARESDGTVSVSVSRAGDARSAGYVRYETADGTATDGDDYAGTAGTLSFAPGETTKSFDVPVVEDATPETDESIAVTLSDPNGGASLGRFSSARIVIHDDEAPMIGFASSAFGTREDAGRATVTVARLGDLSAPASVTCSTSDGSAVAGRDYEATAQRVTFGALQASAACPVAIVNNLIVEPDKTVRLALSEPDGGALGPIADARLVIAPSDQQPDALVRAPAQSFYTGARIFNDTGRLQTVSASVARGRKAVFYVAVQNAGNAANQFRVRAPGGDRSFAVRYFVESTVTNVTSRVVAGSYATDPIAIGATRVLRVEITVSKTAATGATKAIPIVFWWNGDARTLDVVQTVVKVAS